MNGWAVATTAFLASGVEMVEALTIVLAVGFTRGWKPALGATLCALLALGAIVGIAGPLLLTFVPVRVLRFAIGGFALWFGWTWLHKAVLRASGRKALRDEVASYDREIARLTEQRDARVAFATAFNGVFVEGVEVALIIVSVGTASAAALEWAIGGATAALALVIAAGLALHKPLARVPENAMKLAVGIALCTFGVFFLGEGLGVEWPGNDLAILGIAAVLAAATATVVAALRPAKA